MQLSPYTLQCAENVWRRFPEAFMLLGEPPRDGAEEATAQSGDVPTRNLPKLRHRQLCSARRRPWQQRVVDAPSHKLVEVILPSHWRQEACLTPPGSDSDESVGEEDEKEDNDTATKRRYRAQLQDGDAEGERVAREALAQLQREFDGLKRSVSERVVRELRARGFVPLSTDCQGETLPELGGSSASGLAGGNHGGYRGREQGRGTHGHAAASSFAAGEDSLGTVKQEKRDGRGTPDINCFVTIQRGRECEPRRADLREWPPARPEFVNSSPSRGGPTTEGSSRESSVESSLACRRRMKGLTPVQTKRSETKKEEEQVIRAPHLDRTASIQTQSPGPPSRTRNSAEPEASDRTSGSECFGEGSSHGFSAPGDEDGGMHDPSVRGSRTSSRGCAVGTAATQGSTRAAGPRG